MLVPDDDDRFEAYLKQFRPLTPEPLRTKKDGYASPRTFGRAAWAMAGTTILIAAVVTLHFRANRTHSAKEMGSAPNIEQLINSPPLTISGANALLATASSYKAAVDEMAFQPQVASLPKDKHSALIVLSKENIKL